MNAYAIRGSGWCNDSVSGDARCANQPNIQGVHWLIHLASLYITCGQPAGFCAKLNYFEILIHKTRLAPASASKGELTPGG